MREESKNIFCSDIPTLTSSTDIREWWSLRWLPQLGQFKNLLIELIKLNVIGSGRHYVAAR